MILFLALIPATMLSIAGLVALFLSARSDGAIKTVGRFLGYWAFTLAVLVILGSVVAAAHMRGLRGRYHYPVGPMRGPAVTAPSDQTPGTPANPAPPPNASQK